jgi:uncharacterized protein
MGIPSETAVHSPNSDRTLVIMAKAPRPGMVKTRLTPSLPVPAVTDFYRCLLVDTLALTRSLSTVEIAVMCPASDVEELARLIGDGIRVVAQKGDGLAAGLTSVFTHFTAAGRQRVIAFNSDTPHLPSSTLIDAFDALSNHDLIVGPTHDGGYYLIGAKTAHGTLFAGDGMGTASALQRLMTRAQALKLSVAFSEPFYDIDIAEDLLRLAAELQHAPERAPRTADWLKQWAPALARLQTGDL